MRDPDTPGGFNDSMACRPASSSATAEDMMTGPRDISVQSIQFCGAVEQAKCQIECYFLLLCFALLFLLCFSFHLSPPIQATMESDQGGERTV